MPTLIDTDAPARASVQHNQRSASKGSSLVLSLASSADEIREAQRLRGRVFSETMNLSFGQGQEAIDSDPYDAVCQHLLVRDRGSGEVVGTYRFLSPSAAQRYGSYYSESEFDLAPLIELRPAMAEIGRACVHPDYRDGGVIAMLWSGLALLLQREHCMYLMGCSSIGLADGARHAWAVHRTLAERHLAPAAFRVQPRRPLPPLPEATPPETRIPPLIKGYLRAGAWLCSNPAWDPEFHCADLFLLISLARLEQRYARHFMNRC